MPNITINNLKVQYVNKKKSVYTAIDNLSLDLKDGSFNCVVGYSGSGKTTLLRSIAGFVDYEGEILFNGVDIDGVAIKDRNISMVTQNYVLYRSLTVFENIAFPLKVVGASK